MLSGKKALLVHSSADLYGSDRCLTWIVDLLREQGMQVEVVLPYFGPLADELRKIQVPVHILDPIVFRRNIMKPASLLKLGAVAPVSILDLQNLIKRSKFDIVHSNTGVVIGGSLAAWRCGVPHVWHFRELLTEFKKLWKLHEPFAVKTSREIICISQAVADQFTSEKAKKKISIIYDGIPLVDGNPCLFRQHDDSGPLRLLTIGRLAPYKGQDVLLAAVGDMVGNGLRVELTLVGDVFGGEVDNRRRLEDRASAMGIKDIVHFEGFQRDVDSYLDETDVLVLPSRRPEGLGLVILEAMARCKPVVATNGGGVREIISNGENGILVDPDNPQALSRAIADIAADPVRTRKMAENGVSTVTSKFSLQRMNDDLMKVYRKALGK